QAKRAEGYLQRNYLTPQETMADIAEWNAGRKRQRKNEAAAAASAELLQFYNQARYGAAELPESEVLRLKEKLKL
ncbi:hypothetical protein AMQ83_25380, partial [Paenibacillus riograndensis]